MDIYIEAESYTGLPAEVALWQLALLPASLPAVQDLLLATPDHFQLPAGRHKNTTIYVHIHGSFYSC